MNTIAAAEEPFWMALARREIGIKEIPGPGDHPRIMEYKSLARWSPKENHDEIPWCSDFQNFVFECSNIASPRSAAARSWEDWGQALEELQVGCIVVFSRGPNPKHGHVGLYTGDDPNDPSMVRILGGNQSNRVCISSYPRERIVAKRWPLLL